MDKCHDGTLHILPFGGSSLAVRIQEIYTAALEEAGNDSRNILVLKRHPNAVPEFTADLRNAIGLQARPNVKSIARHASSVLDDARPGLTRLSYEERIEFLAQVLNNYNWSSYFDTASDHDSFGRDVGQLLLEVTWQGGFDLPDDPHDYLKELAAVNQSFHEKLDQRDLIEQADIIPQAIEELEHQEVRERIEREFEVVVAVEYEEYSAIEREYLASLTENAELICVAERHASIERIKRESGGVNRLTEGMCVVDHTNPEADTEIEIPETGSELTGQPFGEYLATGDCEPTEGTASARLIEGNTLDEQIEEVANEIEYLRREHGWDYEDFAVLQRSVGDPMPRIRRVLQHSGVPTASAGVNGLEQDLAVRELHALARYHVDDENEALALLQSRVPEADDSLIQNCVVEQSIAESLKRWIVNTGIKQRIVKGTAEIDAQEQFRNVSRLLSIAEFVDSQDFLASDWFQFTALLERAITYDAPYAHTVSVDVAEGGVTVGDVALLKNDSRKVIFLVNVVDSEYPGNETLSPLFPTAQIKEVEGYPAVTKPTEVDVTDTFDTVSATSGNEFERYHNERSRRQLAIGARAAEEQLYFCTYRRSDTIVGRVQHQSRYLHDVIEHPQLMVEEIGGPGTDRDIYTLSSASSEILAQPWAELERIQREASTGGEVELESTEETLAAVQKILEERDDVDPRFERAVMTQFDLARGAIRPESDQNGGGEA
ncbi:hypothetical protein [Halomicrobium salinisoli]|uniref:hypothetical protein n=1 Tax=Halomicrobium salinisoli TaxID=2878391 RepID=UPI001CF02261|nr:hypothetical protein [Halomicrobium salinisoli]